MFSKILHVYLILFLTICTSLPYFDGLYDANPNRVNIYGEVPMWFVKETKDYVNFKSFKRKILKEDNFQIEKLDHQTGKNVAGAVSSTFPSPATIFVTKSRETNHQTKFESAILHTSTFNPNSNTHSELMVEKENFINSEISEKNSSSHESTNEDVIRRRKLERERNGIVDYPEFREEGGTNETETGEHGHKEKPKCLVFELLEGIAEFGKGLSIFLNLATEG